MSHLALLTALSRCTLRLLSQATSEGVAAGIHALAVSDGAAVAFLAFIQTAVATLMVDDKLNDKSIPFVFKAVIGKLHNVDV